MIKEFSMMMNLNTLIQPDLIVKDLDVRSKKEAIERLVDHLYQKRPDCFGLAGPGETLEIIHAREAMQSTGLGNGIAFPHGRVYGWHTFSVVIGITKEGLEFQSADGKPVHVICLMISSEDEPYDILKAMAALSRLFHSVENPADLFDGNRLNTIAEGIHKADEKTEKQIVAHDLMRPVKAMVRLDTPVQEVARTMHLHHLDSLPVVDDNGKFFGVISCSDIFSYGIPDFFNQLHTVAFIRHIDPFEKYYKIRKTLKVSDLIERDRTAGISKENTLLEIIFQLTVKQRSRLFVLDDGILAGEIDRFSIVDKILFY